MENELLKLRCKPERELTPEDFYLIKIYEALQFHYDDLQDMTNITKALSKAQLFIQGEITKHYYK